MLKKFNKLLLAGAACLYGSCTMEKLGINNKGIDVSHHQNHIRWSELKNSGEVAFAIAKASEGKTFKDSKFKDNWKEMAGLDIRGAYHFMNFTMLCKRLEEEPLPDGATSLTEGRVAQIKSEEASRQMDNFLSQLAEAGGLTPGNIIALDVEENGKADHKVYAHVGGMIEESVRYLRNRTSLHPYIYTRTGFWNTHVVDTPEIVKQCPLWIARWRADRKDDKPPLPNELPNGWATWNIWQYSDQGKVVGIDGNVDLNKKCF